MIVRQMGEMIGTRAGSGGVDDRGDSLGSGGMGLDRRLGWGPRRGADGPLIAKKPSTQWVPRRGTVAGGVMSGLPALCISRSCIFQQAFVDNFFRYVEFDSKPLGDNFLCRVRGGVHARSSSLFF